MRGVETPVLSSEFCFLNSEFCLSLRGAVHFRRRRSGIQNSETRIQNSEERPLRVGRASPSIDALSSGARAGTRSSSTNTARACFDRATDKSVCPTLAFARKPVWWRAPDPPRFMLRGDFAETQVASPALATTRCRRTTRRRFVVPTA